MAPIEINIHHIGSTAVVGLSAKNCIDMLGVVDDIENIDPMILPLIQLGYEYQGEYGVSGRVYFSKSSGPKCHLHVFQKGNPNIEKHLSYVRLMNKTPQLVDEFNQLKNKLHALYPNNKNRYQQEKAFFYEIRDRY